MPRATPQRATARAPFLARCALAIGVLSTAQGCSYLFVDGPPPGHEHMYYFDCTQSRLAPIADTVFAGAYAVSAATQAIDGGDGAGSTSGAAPVVILAMLGIAAVDGASAVYGFGKTSKCAAAKKAWAERSMAGRASGACGSDLDCKGDRVCEAGLCVMPPPPLPLPAETAPDGSMLQEPPALQEPPVLQEPPAPDTAPAPMPETL